jgi:hypothetical protein
LSLPKETALMQIFETTSAQDARRCRYAQYGGQAKTLTLCGSTITGMVRSVLEDVSCTPKKWIIKITVN